MPKGVKEAYAKSKPMKGNSSKKTSGVMMTKKEMVTHMNKVHSVEHKEMGGMM